MLFGIITETFFNNSYNKKVSINDKFNQLLQKLEELDNNNL